ncbi:Vegetative incompatibility protein [Arachis hypogaea]|nr:Vegetative incompatibility protein [Arachis hypogaea]
MNAYDDAINAVAVSNDGRVYTGSADKRIKVWKKKKGGGQGVVGEKSKSKNKHYLVDTLENHKSGINALALNGDGSLLYSGACDRSILLWAKKEEDKEREGGDGKMVVVGAIRAHGRSILCLVVVMDFVVSGSEDKTIRVWRGFGGRKYSCVAVLEGHRGPTAMVDHNHDDTSQASVVVYSGSLDSDIKMQVERHFVRRLDS